MDDLEVGVIVLVLLGILAVAGFSTPGPKPQPVQSPQPGQSLSYRQIARQEAINAGIDPNLFERQINQESGFNPNAISSAGAIGIAQIMPSTAQGWGVNPHDPVASLRAAANAMASYLHSYGSWEKALGCYNAGCGRVDWAMRNCAHWLHCMPLETQNYVRIIL